MEANTFRSMMLIGGVMVLAVVTACFFTVPIVEVDNQSKYHYEAVMNDDLGDADHLTGYQAIVFSVQGKIRGTVEHY
ncbi:hypothetical protein HXA34_20665 [Salipaludibacillus agaradhaerens]|uniref:hypothetical protein n=1 Tax=Salipaludibacillus agaradhaerens TaxID=76935 RepID=UPI0021519FC4|nr:hypothetical protein [Salipaludibacillus agaradhaerens]MCR6108713.1 hypothetical protein [Salipaludibacillus agaradhaerens]MCR6120736.1 hypothetical protein [Salipaludibacillus agaradhaerens]